MQVKKFEARTMKEALELVKTQLGPDAIILSVRDNNRSFGLVGEGSVEITAAVSDETLQKKKFAESRLREQDREKLLKASARQQKEIIEKMVNKHLEKEYKPTITQRRYIDIDDEAAALQSQAAEERVRQASLRSKHNPYDSVANTAARGTATASPSSQVTRSQVASAVSRPQNQIQSQPVQPASRAETEEIRALKTELESLRQILSGFQQMPQSFAGTHPGASYGLPYEVSYMFEKLIQAGVAEDITADILEKAINAIPAAKLKNRSLVDGWVARYILDTTTTVPEGRHAKVQCFFGPAGSGKTAAMVKMASHLVVREGKKVALLTADTYKVGSADQLKIYAQILNVPFAAVRSQSDWNNILKYLGNIDVVLVDFPGVALKNAEEISAIRNVLPPQQLAAKIHLVLPATVKDQDAVEIGRRYSVFNYTDVIFTGLDESTQHGSIYNFMRRFDVPLHSFGIGPRIPEDFEFATRERVLDLLFKITKVENKTNEAKSL